MLLVGTRFRIDLTAAFIPTNIVLPMFFQGVHGVGPMQSGIQLLPYAIFVSWSTVVAGQIQSRLRIVRPVAWVGYGICALAFGLLYHYFVSTIPLSLQIGLLILAGFGVGLSLATPLLILQAAMPLKEMAAVTAAWTLTRSLGGSVGVAVFTAILNTNLRNKFAKVDAAYGGNVGVPTSLGGYQAIHSMPDSPLKRAVLAAFADSFKLVWLVMMILFAVCLIVTLPTRAYSLNRQRGPAAAEAEIPTEIIAEGEGAEPIGLDRTERVEMGTPSTVRGSQEKIEGEVLAK